MSKEIALEYLEEAEHYLQRAINNFTYAKEELDLMNDDEWNLVADIETEISNLIKAKLSIKELI